MLALPPATRALYAEAFTQSLSTVFLVATSIAVVGFLMSLFLPDRALRSTIAASAREVGTEMGETFPMPADEDSFPILMRALGVVADRDVQREYIERIVARAGVDLSPAAAWLLLKIEDDPHTDTALLARAHGIETALLSAGLAELEEKGLVEEEPSSDGAKETHSLTSGGCDVFDKIGDARRLHLTEVFSEWPAEKHQEVEQAMQRLRDELVPAAHRTTPKSTTEFVVRS